MYILGGLDVVKMRQIKVFVQELRLKRWFLAVTNIYYLTSEWPGHKGSVGAFLSTQKSPQKSKLTKKNTLESKSTFLSPQKSGQKSFIDQKSAQKSALLSDQLKKVLKIEWVTQNR